MADDLNLRTKYPSIQALKDKGLPADLIALAEQTKLRLKATYAISALPKSDYDRIKNLFTEGKVNEALTEIGKKGITLPQDMIGSLQSLMATPVKDNKLFDQIAAQIPGMSFFDGVGKVQEGITGGLSGLWNHLFAEQDSKNVRFKGNQAEKIAAAYAGAMYERTKDIEVKSFSDGLFSKEFFTYLGAGMNFLSNFIGGSEIGIAVQAGVTWLMENVSALFTGKPTRSYDEIAGAIRAGYESNNNKELPDYVRAKYQGQVRDQVGKDLVASGVISAQELPAVIDPNRARDKNGNPLDANGKPIDPKSVAGQTREPSHLGKVTNGIGEMAKGGAAIVAAPLTWSVGQVMQQGGKTIEAARDGEVGETLVNAAATLAAAKATQISATGIKVGERQIPGVVQAFSWVGKKIGEAVEWVGARTDVKANAKDTIGAKTWVAQQAEEAKAALKAKNPTATEKQLADAALKAEFDAHKIAAEKLNELKAARVAEINVIERSGKALQQSAGRVTAVADTARDVSFVRPILKSPITGIKALFGFGAEAVDGVKGAVNAAAAERAAANFAARTGLAPEAALAARGFRMTGGTAGTVGLGALIAGGATYAMTGDANAALHNAGEAAPVTGTLMAANQGRTVEAWIRGTTDAGTAGTLVTSPLAATGLGATVPTVIGVGTMVFNEVARPVARVFGADVDPSLGELAMRGAAEQIDAAGKRVEQRKALEYTGQELRDGLLNNKSVIYAHFAGEASKQYDKTIATLKANNDGELPSTLPPSLRNRDSYVAARIEETLRLKAGAAAMDAPTGVKRLDLPTADEGIAAAASEIARESARATGLGKTGAKAAPVLAGKDLLSFVPDSISGNVPDRQHGVN